MSSSESEDSSSSSSSSEGETWAGESSSCSSSEEITGVGSLFCQMAGEDGSELLPGGGDREISAGGMES